jgi:hypothetical protein
MNRLGRAYEAIVFGSAMLGMAALAACSGQTFTVGTNGSTTQPIDLSVAGGTAGPSCDTGWAHPSVCCDPTGTSCEVYTTTSLQVCPEDHPVTRPDGRSCCPLNASGSCVPSSGGAAASGAGSSCMYACLPGYTLSTPQGDQLTNQCCNASGSDCYAVTNPDCSEPVCNCPAQTTGANSCTCSPAPACPLPSPPSCDACPSGWQVPTGDPALCCRNDPAMPSVIDCFSQAIPLPRPGDAGTGPAPCIENGVSHADGTSWTCTDGCNTCTCNNGQAISTLLACAADAAPPPAKDAGPAPCVDNGVSHANGTSWTCSNDACGGCFCDNGTIARASTIACPVLDGGSGSADASPPPPVDAAECSVASDCKGALPALCEVCTNGGDGCAKFACNAGICEIVYCE